MTDRLVGRGEALASVVSTVPAAADGADSAANTFSVMIWPVTSFRARPAIAPDLCFALAGRWSLEGVKDLSALAALGGAAVSGLKGMTLN